jgi:hypothetical protein
MHTSNGSSVITIKIKNQVHRMFQNFISELQEVIPEVILSEKCYINVGTIRDSYG